MNHTVETLLLAIAFLAAVMAIVSGFIWAERRLLGLWQNRLGPNRVGPLGVLQVVADIIKIFMKEDWIPPFADRAVFLLAPAIAVGPLLMGFAVIPVTREIVVSRLDIGLLFILGMGSLEVYGIVLGGWASNDKYSLLGALRGAAQLITYEVFMGLSLMGVVMMSGSFNLLAIVEAQRELWFCVPQAVGFVIFMIAGIAQTRRLPFDLPEAEPELVAGFHTEYSSMKFGMFYLGEYIAVLLVSSLTVTLFFGGWLGPSFLPGPVWFALKTAVFVVFFFLLRGSLPRPRYDQFLAYGWKLLLPLSLINLALTGAILLR